MLKEIVEDYIEKGNTIITAKPGGGATVFSLYLCNILLKQDKTILYYNPTAEIDVYYVKKYFPRVYRDVFFIRSPLNSFLHLINEMDYDMDYLVIDPGDCLMVNPKIVSAIADIVKRKDTKFICTSQIRVDPTLGGQVYSTIEKLNKRHSGSIFENSMWIRDVTETNTIYTSRYIDVFDKYRVGNRYKSRYLAKFSKTSGTVME